MTIPATDSIQANGLAMQDFLKILLTQLNYQDPLKPMDNQQFMAQMAQFSALQQTQQLNTKLDQLAATQASLQSVGLLGKNVDVATAHGRVSGIVTALTLNNGAPLVSISTASGAALDGIGLGQIEQVR